MKAGIFRGLALVAILCIGGTRSIAHAQMDQGQIIGTVVDKSNAPIKGAAVEVIDERTGESRKTTTGEDGSYQIIALRPSFYTVRVTMDQFAPAEIAQVQLTVGQEVRRNFTLQVASLSSAVTVVESVESAIDTTSAAIGVNVNLREVSELPLNGRQVSQLFLQAPGATNSGGGTFGEIRFSGRAVEQNAVRYDGIEGGGVIDSQPGVLNGEIPTPFRLQSSLENVQEFRVESNNYPAEFGTGTGGQISVVTRSGSNAFHGSAYEYFRNDRLDAHNFFDLGSKPSQLRLNQFGASFGGPIAKDRLFFYAYYEGYRVRAGINNIESVPSATVRSLPACTSGQKAGPTTCVDAKVQPLLAAFIGPGAFLLQGQSKDPTNFDIYQLNGRTTISENSGGLRFDYHISNKYTLFARYFRDQGNWLYPEGVSGRTVSIVDNPQNGVLSFQSNISNSVINEAKVGYNEALSRIDGRAPTVNGIDLSAIAINLSGNVANSGIAGQGSTTGVTTPGGLVRSNSAANGRGQPYTPYSISFVDNLSWLAGKHNMKFGAEVRLVRMYTDRLGGTTYSFSNLTNFLQNSASSVQYLGDVSSPSPYNNGATGPRFLKQNLYIGYVQDEFKLRPNLTLNYGLRYEYYEPLHEDRNLYVKFDTTKGVLSTPNFCESPIISQATPGICSGYTKPWYTGDPSSFGPRIGIAWTPRASHTGLFGGDHTVLRAGFGLFYGPGQAEDTLQPAESDRVWQTLSNVSGAFCLTSPGCTVTPAQITTNFVNALQNNTFTASAQFRAYAPEYTVPERIYQYSGSWQQQWAYGLVSTVAYVGSQGRNLFLRNIANRIVSIAQPDATKSATVIRQFSVVSGDPTLPAPNTGTVKNPYAEIDYKTSGGNDSYNSLQAQLLRRYNTGLTLSAQYTFAKSFGNSSGSNEALTTGDPFDYNYDRGYNAFDIRHAFNVSALYDLPFGRKKQHLGNLGGFAQAVLGNWELGTIVSARSGLPVDMRIVRPDVVYVDNTTGGIFSSAAAGRTAVINVPGGGGSRNVRRPDLIPGVNPFLPSGELNPAAFAVPKPGTFGNLMRGALHGPNDWQADLTASKKFPIHEFTNLEFRAEFYNILNHPNFANPPSTLNPTYSGILAGQPFTSASAGGGGVFGKFNQTISTTVGTGTNRQIQLAMRLNF